MPDEKDKKPDADGQIPLDQSLSQARETLVDTTHRELRRLIHARRQTAKSMAYVLRSHYAVLAGIRRWRNTSGQVIGLMDHNGLHIESQIRESLLSIGKLANDDPNLLLRENTRKRLEEAANLVDPKLMELVRASLDPIGQALTELKAKVANVADHSDYLLRFRGDEELRHNLMEILKLMDGLKPLDKEFANNEWIRENEVKIRPYSDQALFDEMTRINRMQKARTGCEMGTECQALFNLQERQRNRILGLASRNRKTLRVAREMPSLMAGSLGLMTHGISLPSGSLFYDTGSELGDTDAESMRITYDTVNRCLLAFTDITRTRQVIPALT